VRYRRLPPVCHLCPIRVTTTPVCHGQPGPTARPRRRTCLRRWSCCQRLSAPAEPRGPDGAGAQSAWERPAPFRVSRGSSTLAWTEPNTEGAGRPAPSTAANGLTYLGLDVHRDTISAAVLGPRALSERRNAHHHLGRQQFESPHPQWPALRAPTPTRWSRHRFDQRLGWRRVIARGDPSGPREHANRHFTDRPVLFGHPGATRIPGEHQRHLPPNPARPRCARARRRTPTAAPCAATPAGIPAQLDACMS
jgi:hypothetical protein